MKRSLVAVLSFSVTFAALALTATSQPPPGGEKKGGVGKGPGGGGAEKGGPPRYEIGQIFPPFVKDGLDLTEKQRNQIDELEKDLKAKLDKILTAEQKKKIGEIRPPMPGGPPGGGPPGGEGGGQTDTTSKPNFGSGKENPAPATPTGLKSIGGRWFVREGKPNIYFFRDGARFVDLFSNQLGDSNKDGIPDLRIEHDEKFLILKSQNLPNHPTAKFPNSGNPNTIRVQDMTFKLPLVPKPSDTITPVPMGAIGTAINGVVFFNPFEMGGMNAVAGYSEVWFDSCCGHPQQSGVYHYHKYPSCVKTPFPDDGDSHSPVIGFAWDGYPVYGPYDDAKVMAKDLKGEKALDVCNGHFDADRGYHYHATPEKFPYMLGGYAGVVETSNSRALGRAGAGAIKDTQSGESPEGAAIVSVKPGTAERGESHLVRIELRAGSVPAGIPNRVVIGPFEGAKLARIGDVVTCEIAIPKDANRGSLLDGHLEFADGRRGTATVKKNNVFRVGGK